MARSLAPLALALSLTPLALSLAACGRAAADAAGHPDASAAPLTSGSASVAPAASGSAPVAPVDPDHWTDSSRVIVSEMVAYVAAHRGPFVLAASLDSELGDEGELYLERSGDQVVGQWENTLVAGTLDPAGALSLRDLVSGQVILEGQVGPGQLTGTLRAEGERRSVRSAPRRDVATLSEKLSVTDGKRPVEVTLVKGQTQKAPFSFFHRRGPAAVTARPVDGALELTDKRGTWTMHPTARGLLGRAPDGSLVRASFRQADAGATRLPWQRGGMEVADRVLGQGHYPATKCEISVSQPTVRGTAHDAELTADLRRRALEAARAPWGDAREPARPGDFVCHIDASTPMQIQSSWYTAEGLRGGFVGLQLTGYTRFSDVGAVAATAQCLLLDTRQGRLITDVLKELPEAARRSLLLSANRVLRRKVRSVRLTDNPDYLVNELTSLDDLGVCMTPSGIDLMVGSGTSLERGLAGVAVVDHIEVPAALVAPDVPAEHPLRPLFVP